MFRLGKLWIKPGFLALLAIAYFAGASEVLPLAFLAALIHEMAHVAALRIAGVGVEVIYLSAFGAEIQADTRFIPYWKDVICTLAGPAANILLGVILGRVSGDYLFAGANLLQGGFNLLPVSGLDGARALHLVISWGFDPSVADRVCRAVEIAFAVALLLVSIYLVAFRSVGGFLMFATMGVFGSTVKGWRGK